MSIGFIPNLFFAWYFIYLSGGRFQQYESISFIRNLFFEWYFLYFSGRRFQQYVSINFILNTDNEAITILLKNSQKSISISTIYIPPVSNINTALLDNIKKTVDNIIITGDLNAKHTDVNCTKTDKWGLALKKLLYNVDLFIADNSNPTHRAGRTNTYDI